jgi:hypothetical protein
MDKDNVDPNELPFQLSDSFSSECDDSSPKKKAQNKYHF